MPCKQCDGLRYVVFDQTEFYVSLIFQQNRMIAESKPEAANLEGAIQIAKDKRDQAIREFLNHVREAHEASPR